MVKQRQNYLNVNDFHYCHIKTEQGDAYFSRKAILFFPKQSAKFSIECLVFARNNMIFKLFMINEEFTTKTE